MNTWAYNDIQINSVFKTKYPNGKIKTIRYDFSNNKIMFKIKYNQFQKYITVWKKSYLELLQSLGFNVISGTMAYAMIITIKNFEKRISDMENPNGYYFDEDYFIPFTENDLTEIPRDIESMKKTLKENIALFVDTADFQKRYYEENINTL